MTPLRAADALGLVALLVLLHVALSGQLRATPLSPQGYNNVAFATARSLGDAIADYPKVWPPLYPIVLRMGSMAHVPVRRANEVLFALLIAWLLVFARSQGVPRASLYPALALVAIAGFDLYNVAQPASEVLLSLTGLLLLHAILVFGTLPSASALAAVAVLSATIYLTRWNAVLWMLPIAIGAIAVAPVSGRRRARYLVVYAATALVPLLAWMAWVHRETGTLTGMDRIAQRDLPAYLAYWPEMNMPSNVTRLILRTLAIDFLSPADPASHWTVDQYRLSLSDGLAGMLLLATAVSALLALRPLGRGIPFRTRLQSAFASPMGLVTLSIASYLVSLIVIWSTSNNDPIYSRFLFPIYAPAVLLGLLIDTRLRDFPRAFARRLPLLVLFVWVFVAQLQRLGRLF
jgi:hypothetical protein